jgi:hypothetical protein
MVSGRLGLCSGTPLELRREPSDFLDRRILGKSDVCGDIERDAIGIKSETTSSSGRVASSSCVQPSLTSGLDPGEIIHDPRHRDNATE